MKFIFFLLLFLFICQVKAIESKSIPALERIISIQVANTKIATILDLIENQTGVVFSYTQGTFSNASISFNVQQKTVRYALNQLFNDKISYTIKDKYIILKKIDVQARKKNVKSKIIEGYITEPTSGMIITNATVYDESLMASAITDRYGYFKIELPQGDDSVKLHIRKEGYKEIVIKSDTNWQFIDIRLSRKVNTLITAIDSISNKMTRDLQVKIPEWLVSNNKAANTMNLPDTFWRKTQFSILPYVGTNKLFSGNFANDYSFNLLVGYVYEVRKLELGACINIVRTNASYMQAAGIANIVGGQSKGFQYAGTFNYSHSLDGFQGAGTFNSVTSNSRGIQSGGVLNYAHNQFIGIQAAGVLNYANTIKGLQAAGCINVTTKANGWMAAGIANYCVDTIKGTQLAGVINISKREIGSQLAGVVNKSKTINGIQLAGVANYADTIIGSQVSCIYNRATYVNGFQLSLLNFADSCKGASIGLFSYITHGYHKFEISLDELRFTSLSFRTGNHTFHNNFAVGVRSEELNKVVSWYFGYGFGTSFIISKNNSIDIDLTSLELAKGDYFALNSDLYKFDIGIDHQLFNKTSVYFGISINAYKIKNDNKQYSNDLAKIMPYTIKNVKVNSTNELKTWVGAKLALRFN